MSERLTERIVEIFSAYPPAPFTYDADERMFTIGQEKVALDRYADYIAQHADSISSEQALALVEENALLLNVFDNHFQMPRMTEWIRSQTEKDWQNVSNSITETMIQAYAEVSGYDKKQLLKGTFMGFGLVLYRPGHPVFNVVGNCACYGVSPHGYVLDEHYWNDGFAEYESHNIDNQFQLTALHAGAGALAAMVEA